MISARWITEGGDLTDPYSIRRQVFINEQNVPEEIELDEHDKTALHAVVYSSRRPVATGRLITGNGECLIGRVAVLKEERGKGYGDLVMRMLIRRAFDLGYTVQTVHSQTQAVGFYERLGFKAVGSEYLEAGIPHINMRREGDIGGDCG